MAANAQGEGDEEADSTAGRKGKKHWWSRKATAAVVVDPALEAARRRVAERPPPPPPMTAAELAFVRLKVRAGRIVGDLHIGCCSVVEMAHPKPIPTALLSFIASMVSPDFAPADPEDWFLVNALALTPLTARSLLCA